MRIYVVDSDEGTRSMLLYVLGEQSYTASGFETADSFKTALRTELPSLILLDSVMTEKEDGLSLLKWLKADRRTASIPVILLMEKATEMDRVIGLDLGADDYLSKPFGILELLSRMHAILRRTEQPAQREQEPPQRGGDSVCGRIKIKLVSAAYACFGNAEEFARSFGFIGIVKAA